MRFSGTASLATACLLAIGLMDAPPSLAEAGPNAARDPWGSGSVLRLTPDVGLSTRSVEVPAAAALRGPVRTGSYSMVGLTWHGDDPALRVRAHAADGWGPWRAAGVMDDGPTRTRALRSTTLLWVGPSDGVQVRAAGSGYRDLELVLIDPGHLASDRAAAPAAPPPARRTTRTVTPAPTRAPEPPLLSRKQWGADPSWRNGTPRYNLGLRQVHIHHTASGNGYSRADVPAILRGFYRYHTRTLGWFDLAYNFLVDKFGRAWVGRSGGVARLVRGAHTLGFNHNSVGIAVIGNFDRVRPPQKVVTTLVRLAAWKLDRHRRDASGTVLVTSEGSDRYPEGTDVRLPVIDGHRDTNETACPGARLYEKLPAIRRRAQHRLTTYGH